MAKRNKGQPAASEAAATENTDAPVAEVANEASTKKSIVDPKYRNRYKGEEAKDFVSKFIEEQCRVASTDGKSSVFDTGKLFDLALLNGGKQAKVDKLKTQEGGRGYGPRMRMTLGNVIRASARKRHGVVALDGNFHEVDAAFKEKHAKFMKDQPTLNPDGSKIKKESASAPAAA